MTERQTMTETERQTLCEQLRLHEGDEPFVYDDATGKPLRRGDTLVGTLTVGVGRNVTDRPLSERVRALLLEEDIDDVEQDLQQHFTWFDGLDRVRKLAVRDLRFNLGPAKFRGFHHFLQNMAVGRYVQAAEDLRASRWYTQVQPSRAWRIRQQIRDGATPLGTVNV